jgi:hypothetical protein
MRKGAHSGTVFVAATFLAVIVADGAFARGGGGGHGSGSHSTSGYSRSNGTYVPGYHATNPNSTKLDNYSTKGNVNPWTGKPGTKSPYGSSTGPFHSYGYYGRSWPDASIASAVGLSAWPSAHSPGSSLNLSTSPATVYNGYHPHWTIQVVH